MQSFVIRDPARVRNYLVVLTISLVLLVGWVVARRFIGPPEQIPITMYAVIGAILIAWNVTGIISRSDLVRVDASGISSGTDRFGWGQIRTATASGAQLAVTVKGRGGPAGSRRLLDIPPDQIDGLNTAIAQHRDAHRAQDGTNR